MSRLLTIRVPTPFKMGRNSVYVVLADPITMIDTGTATERAYDALLAGLTEHGLAPADIKRVILTHKHIDHIGNAWRIQRQSSAEIMIYESELAAVTDVDPSGERYAALVRRRYTEWQVPEAARPPEAETAVSPWVIESAAATPLQDGQRIPVGDDHLEVVHTPGHTKGSICLNYGRHFFCGDHVLPHMSPNIGGGDLRHRGLLGDYLRSLKHVRDTYCGQAAEFLPGHGAPIADPRRRCDELSAHHENRLGKLVAILHQGNPSPVYDIARQLFGELKTFHLALGCAEAEAHLDYLVDQQRAVVEDGQYRLA